MQATLDPMRVTLDETVLRTHPITKKGNTAEEKQEWAFQALQVKKWDPMRESVPKQKSRGFNIKNSIKNWRIKRWDGIWAQYQEKVPDHAKNPAQKKNYGKKGGRSIRGSPKRKIPFSYKCLRGK